MVLPFKNNLIAAIDLKLFVVRVTFNVRKKSNNPAPVERNLESSIVIKQMILNVIEYVKKRNPAKYTIVMKNAAQ